MRVAGFAVVGLLLSSNAALTGAVDFVGNTVTLSNPTGQQITFCVRNDGESDHYVTARFLGDSYPVGIVGIGKTECAVITTPRLGQDQIELEY